MGGEPFCVQKGSPPNTPLSKKTLIFFRKGCAVFEPTLKSAMEYANHGKTEEWVHCFLLGDEGGNKSLSDAIKSYKPKCIAPKLMRLDLFKRIHEWKAEKYALAGEREEWFWNQVNAQVERYNTGEWDMPPLMADMKNREGFYNLFDGNHRIEALKKLGIKEYWVIGLEE